MIRLWAALAAVCVGSVVFTACGGGGGGDSTEAKATPNRAVVVRCMQHSGTGARIYQREVPAQIGGLPAHVEISGVGYEEGGFEFSTTGIYLFKNADEGQEGAESLEGEYPRAEVKAFDGGTAVGVVLPEGSGTPTPKDMALIEKCVA